MMRALWSAASGMKAQQSQMDVVAHNIANVNTYGGKKVRAEFQDLVYQTLREAGARNGADSQYPTALQIGLGTRLAATQRVFTQGALQTTDNPTDIGIQGEGFFRVTMPDGTTAYTRDGTWKLDSDRRMVTTDGYLLADGIRSVRMHRWTPSRSPATAVSPTARQGRTSSRRRDRSRLPALSTPQG